MTPDWLIGVLFRLDLTSRDDRDHKENTKWSTALGTRLHLYNITTMLSLCSVFINRRRARQRGKYRQGINFKVIYCLSCT